MTVYSVYKLYCTACGKEFEEESDESADQLRMWAESENWKYIKVKNGSYWDFCPRCIKNHEKEQ